MPMQRSKSPSTYEPDADTYRAQPITVELIKKLAKLPPPPRKPGTKVAFKEVRDKEHGLVLRHQGNGKLLLYVQVGRARRERPFGKTCDARRIIDPTDPLTLKMVRMEAKRLRGEAAGGRDFKGERDVVRGIPTLRRYLEDVYGPWVKQNRRSGAATLARIEACFLDELGDDKLDRITPARIEPWRTRRQREGVKPETINRDIDALRAALTRAVKLEIISKNPLLGAERAEVDRHKQPVRALTAAEKAKLIEALEARDDKKRAERASANEWRAQRGYPVLPPIGKFADVLTPAVIVSLETGLRKSELFALKWESVDIGERMVRVEGETAKTYQTREIPMNDRAFRTLRDWWLQCGQPKSGLVFTQDGEPIGNLKRSYHAVLAAAGIKRVHRGKRVNWHSLRHTFGSLLGAAGVEPVTLMKLMGHANLATTQRYLHTDADRKREAVEKLA